MPVLPLRAANDLQPLHCEGIDGAGPAVGGTFEDVRSPGEVEGGCDVWLWDAK
jgi:hypothetical protein